MHLKKIALIVEYDGSRFHGFQVQPQSPTIQEALEDAIRALTGEDLRVRCASRTDAGVHALGQTVSFHTASLHGPDTILRALNYHLPDDVCVRGAYEVREGFDVRGEAICRRYRYVVLNRRSRSPVLRGRAYHVPGSLDLDSMNGAAQCLLGTRDFAPFCGPMFPPGSSTVRRLTQAQFSRSGDMVHFNVAGSSFLPQQVRRMAGALLNVGLGKLSLNEFEAGASGSDRGIMGPTAPAHGLFLMEVRYRDFPPSAADAKNDE